MDGRYLSQFMLDLIEWKLYRSPIWWLHNSLQPSLLYLQPPLMVRQGYCKRMYKVLITALFEPGPSAVTRHASIKDCQISKTNSFRQGTVTNLASAHKASNSSPVADFEVAAGLGANLCHDSHNLVPATAKPP